MFDVDEDVQEFGVGFFGEDDVCYFVDGDVVELYGVVDGEVVDVVEFDVVFVC